MKKLKCCEIAPSLIHALSTKCRLASRFLTKRRWTVNKPAGLLRHRPPHRRLRHPLALLRVLLSGSRVVLIKNKVLSFIKRSSILTEHIFEIEMFFMDHLHWWHLLVKPPVTATWDVTWLELATLGGMTQIGSFLFMSCCPRWPKQVSSDCRCRQHHRANFRQWKYSFNINRWRILKLIFPSLKWKLMPCNWEKSASSFCCQVAAWVLDILHNFCLLKNLKFADDSTTTEAWEKK